MTRKPTVVAVDTFPPQSVEYDAFLSYSKNHDGKLAEQLHDSLEKFIRIGKQPITIYRDETDLDGTLSLRKNIEHALAHSRRFILLASPGSAKSAWVDMEIGYFVSNRGLENVSIALINGRSPWLDADVRPGTSDDCALSPKVFELLKHAFPEGPKIVDLRRYRTETGELDERATGFENRIAELAAPILGWRKRLTRRRRIKKGILVVAGVLLLLVGIIGYQHWRSVRTREEVIELKTTERHLQGRLREIELARLQLQKELDEARRRDSGLAPTKEVERLAVRVDQLLEDFDNEFDLDELSDSDRVIIRNARAESASAVYRIHPPDILAIDAIHISPRPPYRLRSGDVLGIDADGVLPDPPIEGTYVIQPGGAVNFPRPCGSVTVAGLTLDEAEEAIDRHLREYFVEPLVSIELLEMTPMQLIAGEHIVAVDGTVTLGRYGSVLVEGKSIAEAKKAIEEHLAQFLEDPEVSVDIWAFNSMAYYVTVHDTQLGDTVNRFPITGRETVTDALAQLQSLPPIERIRIFNPDSKKGLLVDWRAIQTGDFSTDYRILAGDRIVIEAKQR